MRISTRALLIVAAALTAFLIGVIVRDSADRGEHGPAVTDLTVERHGFCRGRSGLSASTAASARSWLVDKEGWVLADSGTGQTPETQKTTWLQRLLYRLVAGSRTELQDTWSAEPVRFSDKVVQTALSGQEAIGLVRSVSLSRA